MCARVHGGLVPIDRIDCVLRLMRACASLINSPLAAGSRALIKRMLTGCLWVMIIFIYLKTEMLLIKSFVFLDHNPEFNAFVS